jgi:hypothetical protein
VRPAYPWDLWLKWYVRSLDEDDFTGHWGGITSSYANTWFEVEL